MVQPLSILAICSVAGGQVADFAPLEVGNTWVYLGSNYNEDQQRSAGHSVRKTFKVLSKAGTGDSTVYEISVRDSLYDRRDSSAVGGVLNLPDSVVMRTDSLRESGDTLSSGLQKFFFRHSVPDSMKNREVGSRGATNAIFITERMTGPFPIEDDQRWVYQRKINHVLGMGEARADSSIFVQNLGAVLVAGSGGRGGTYSSGGRYRLVEFNGEPVEYTHLPGTSLGPRIRGITRPVARDFGSLLRFRGNRDGLGRRGVSTPMPNLSSTDELFHLR